MYIWGVGCQQGGIAYQNQGKSEISVSAEIFTHNTLNE